MKNVYQIFRDVADFACKTSSFVLSKFCL